MGKFWGKVHVIRCLCCGAGIKEIVSGAVNVKCEYCGQMIRLSADYNSFDSEKVYKEISHLGERIRKDGYDKDYKNAALLIKKHAYMEAWAMLNEILKKDLTQARAWYYKSLLPILDQDEVTYRGKLINIQTVSRLTVRDEIFKYLEECGLGWFASRSFMQHYATGGFLFEQQTHFLNEAIQHGSTPERRDFFKKQKKQLVSKWKTKILQRNLMHAFFGVALVAAGALIVFATQRSFGVIADMFTHLVEGSKT